MREGLVKFADVEGYKRELEARRQYPSHAPRCALERPRCGHDAARGCSAALRRSFGPDGRGGVTPPPAGGNT